MLRSVRLACTTLRPGVPNRNVGDLIKLETSPLPTWSLLGLAPIGFPPPYSLAWQICCNLSNSLALSVRRRVFSKSCRVFLCRMSASFHARTISFYRSLMLGRTFASNASCGACARDFQSAMLTTRDRPRGSKRQCLTQVDFDLPSSEIGGRGGIRTHGALAGTPVFKTGALNHSATLPLLRYQPLGSAQIKNDVF
jgi:hypothetical protein